MAHPQYGKLVNKQFNSPINLYSDSNIREVLDKETQMLSNGAVGINFHSPLVGKPANLQHSAVLRFLEEEENRKRGGHSSSLKRVAWPPEPEAQDHLLEIPAQDLGTPQISSPGLQNKQVSPSANYQQPGSNYYQSANQPSFNPIYQTGTSPSLHYQSNPLSPSTNITPTRFSPVQSPKQWAPVQSPVSVGFQPKFPSPSLQYQPSLLEQNGQEYQYQPPPQQYQYQHSSPYQHQLTNQKQQQQRQIPIQYDPPPSTITLRPIAPVSQVPAPVYSAQPATATFKGGKNLRGDLKWPPPETKERMEEENRARIELAKGPVCRPRKVRKDYTEFFGQHALGNTYPGYKIPPGTQFYVRQ